VKTMTKTTIKFKKENLERLNFYQYFIKTWSETPESMGFCSRFWTYGL